LCIVRFSPGVLVNSCWSRIWSDRAPSGGPASVDRSCLTSWCSSPCAQSAVACSLLGRTDVAGSPAQISRSSRHFQSLEVPFAPSAPRCRPRRPANYLRGSLPWLSVIVTVKNIHAREKRILYFFYIPVVSIFENICRYGSSRCYPMLSLIGDASDACTACTACSQQNNRYQPLRSATFCGHFKSLSNFSHNYLES